MERLGLWPSISGRSTAPGPVPADDMALLVPEARGWHREVDPRTSLSDCPFSPSLSFHSWLDPRVGLDGAGMESLSPVSLKVEGEILEWLHLGHY